MLETVHPERSYESKSTADSTHEGGTVNTNHLTLNMVEHGEHAIGLCTTMLEIKVETKCASEDT